MSETTDLAATGAQDAPGTSEAPAASGTAGSPRRRGNGLSGMLLPELQRLAAELGISGTGRMRKGDLVAAISDRQVGGSGSASGASNDRPVSDAPVRTEAPVNGGPLSGGVAATAAPLEAPISGGANSGPVTEPAQDGAEAPERPPPSAPSVRSRRGASRPAGSPVVDAAPAVDAPAADPDQQCARERAAGRGRAAHRGRPPAAQP